MLCCMKNCSMWTSRLVGLAGLAIACSPGCGKSDSEKFVDSYCAEVAKCCGQEGKAADGKTCHNLMTVFSAAGTYNSANGDACLAEMRSETSTGTFCAQLNAGSSASSSSPCDAVFGNASTGSKKVGETCDFDFDCATPSTGQVGCNLGVCTVLLAAGGACTFAAECVHGAFCDSSKSVCADRVAAGGTCTGRDSAECVDGYYCPSGSLHCTAQVAAGAACTTAAMCQSGSCSSGTCQPNGFDLCGS
jgi:hypothetical protein